MNEISASNDWGRNLHREFRPFRVCDRPLLEQPNYVLRIELQENHVEIPMMGEQPRYSVAIDESMARSIKQLEFSFPFDKSKLAEEASVEPSEIQVALLLKDYKTRNILPIGRWELANLPDTFEIKSDALSKISVADNFEISVVSYLKEDRKAAPGVASKKGATLARCDLAISVEGEIGPDFNVTTISPEDLESLGYGKNTLFIIEPLEDEEDYSKPAKDVFGIRVNEIAAEKLSQIQGANSFGSAFYRMMMADILFQICQKVFVGGIDPNWPENSVGKTLVRFIEKNSSVAIDKIPEYAKNEIDRLQAILQSALELATNVQSATLTGRN